MTAEGEDKGIAVAGNDGRSSAMGDCQSDGESSEVSILPARARESLPSDAQDGESSCESPYSLGPANEVTEFVATLRGGGANLDSGIAVTMSVVRVMPASL